MITWPVMSAGWAPQRSIRCCPWPQVSTIHACLNFSILYAIMPSFSNAACILHQCARYEEAQIEMRSEGRVPQLMRLSAGFANATAVCSFLPETCAPIFSAFTRPRLTDLTFSMTIQGAHQSRPPWLGWASRTPSSAASSYSGPCRFSSCPLSTVPGVLR